MDVLGFDDMSYEVKGQNQELRSCAVEQRTWHFQRYSFWLVLYRNFNFDLKGQGWPQRSCLTLEVEGHLTIKFCLWSQNLTYVWWFELFRFSLNFEDSFWPQGSSLTSEVKSKVANLFSVMNKADIPILSKIGLLLVKLWVFKTKSLMTHIVTLWHCDTVTNRVIEELRS